MRQKNFPRVLAVGLDAAEPTFVRRLIEEGALPTLKHLREQGAWSRVESPAHLGSGAVWPTFFTGTEPAEHGTYSEWCWQPETMSLVRSDGRRLTPFWKKLAQEGMTVGIFDVPFAPPVGLSQGFEIAGWGEHDTSAGHLTFAPNELAELVTKQVAPHPFSFGGQGATGPSDVEGLRALSAACLEGVKLRGELAVRLLEKTRPRFSLVIFPEIHHAAHQLWHTVVPHHGLYTRERLPNLRSVEPTLADILREVDRQIARLVETEGDGAAVLVFSLHGMRPARGLPAFLAPLLCETGFARVAGWATQSWPERVFSLFAAVKRHTPAGLKSLYHSRVPRGVTQRLAQPTMIPAYDWSWTRAFSLPTDQHGWIRINLAGREAKGCVPVTRYQEICQEVEELLHSLVTADGRPLVRDIIHTAEQGEKVLTQSIPDLVVHWHDHAFALPMRVGGLLLEAHPAATGLTGQHAPDGFCIFTGQEGHACETFSATELHRIIIAALAEG
jgi:predicted AlkP superfamily phosphohydrolase/phosphomutase